MAPPSEAPCPPASAAAALANFATTCFEAALDGARGRAWPRSGRCEHDCFETQRRRLIRQATWLGIAPKLCDARRAAVAEALGVPALLLREESRSVARRPGFASRGRAVCAVLRALRSGRGLWPRLAGAAHAAGLVGLPLFWDARSATLHPPPSFRFPGTRAPPG